MSLFIDIAIVRIGVKHSSFAVNSIQIHCCLATSYFCLLIFPAFTQQVPLINFLLWDTAKCIIILAASNLVNNMLFYKVQIYNIL